MILLRKARSLKTRLTTRDQSDNSAYWRQRALTDRPVLWLNTEYNDLFRAEEHRVLRPYLLRLPQGARVLDIGCGIGALTSWIADQRPDAHVDGIDFPEMTRVARERNARPAVTYLDMPAENYCVEERTYDLALSSGAFSAIKDINKLRKAMSNAARMVKPDTGIVLMIDPFHRSPFLARAIFGPEDAKRLMASAGFECHRQSGFLFWPFREMLANSHVRGRRLKTTFQSGEVLLRLLGRNLWSDYKVLEFRSLASAR